MTTHTPGPWSIGNCGYALRVNKPNGHALCEIMDGRSLADASLIAAAPDLLAALKMAQEIIYQYEAEAYEVGGVNYKEAIDAAIAKAEGTQDEDRAMLDDVARYEERS